MITGEIQKKINKFRDERDWRQFHNEKDLAISISLEAAELLELFQWKTSDEGIEDIERVKEELADVLIYCCMLADNLDLNISDIIEEKLKKNSDKYPIKKSKGSKKKYTELLNIEHDNKI
ncbi:nucleotide pyrophosphohydrolase [Lactococcus garvieae]|uniref:Nucleotide pyrophosphohydrolase n=1 Tax=Lactococcus garvieae TaxID=1363 RepID=A0A6L2ZSK6_9LACT|nr:nucleotide pyrophosphohydrolase [Lactococcus garvieae]GFO51039.1 nucleotide pyrophosphohydrolase [Lactococcus garvieae]